MQRGRAPLSDLHGCGTKFEDSSSDACLDGSQRFFQALGGLRLCESFEICQLNYFSLLRVEPTDRLSHRNGDLVLLEIIESLVLGDSVLISQALVESIVETVAPLFGPQPVNGPIACHRGDPREGLSFGRFVKTSFHPDLQAYLLENILCVFVIVEHPINRRVEKAGVSRIKSLECSGVVVGDSLKEREYFLSR